MVLYNFYVYFILLKTDVYVIVSLSAMPPNELCHRSSKKIIYNKQFVVNAHLRCLPPYNKNVLNVVP